MALWSASFTGNDPFIPDSDLYDLIKAIRHRCDIVLALGTLDETAHLLPTILEDLYMDAQVIIDSYCVVADV